MTHRKGAIWTERVLLALILSSLIGSLNLIVALNRRSASQPSSRDANSTLTGPSPAVSSQPMSRISESISGSPRIEKSVDPPIVQKTSEPIPPPASIDPTRKILASLAAATAQEIEASRLADRRAEALERARQASVAESRNWKRRELLVRQQILALNNRADELETSANVLDAERDVLAHERDALKAALSKASQRSGFAVLPYKGPNGTWRRPIVLECTKGGVKLQPRGQNFTTMELSPYLHPRSSPFVRVIARELLHIQSSETPDGAPVVPYLVFLVRPDGIRPYYEARTRLEPLGIAFGYELIEQDLSVDIPDFDNLTTWDGSVPLDMPLETAPLSKSNLAMPSTARQGTSGTSTKSSSWPGGDQSWPAGLGRGSNPQGQLTGTGSSNQETSTPDDFVWPSRRRQADEPDLPGSGSGEMESINDPSKKKSSDYSGTRLGSDQPGPLDSLDTNSSSSIGQRSSSGGASSLGGAARVGDLNPPAIAPGTSRFRGNNSGSGSDNSGGGRATGPAGPPSGPGLGLAGSAGLNSLPDLEPAGDALSPQPVQPRGGSSTGTLSSAGGGAGGGQPPDFGGGQAGGGAFPKDGSASLGSNAMGGGQLLGLAPNQGAAGGASSAAGSGSTPSERGGLGQSFVHGPGSSGRLDQTFVPGKGSSGGGRMSGSGNDATSAASDLPPLPRNQNSGSAADNRQPGAGPNNASDLPPSSDATNALPQGSNAVSGSASGSSSGTSTLTASGPPSATTSTSISNPQTTTNSSSSTSPTTPSSASASGSMSPESMPPSGTPSVPMPSFTFGQSSGSASDSKEKAAPPPPPKPSPTMGRIEVPFEIVVVCRERDVLLHPGGYRLTTQAMKEQRGGKDGLLAREIRALVVQRAQVDPMIRPRPKIKFLVESNGSETFWTARRQLLFSLSDWPMSLQVAESQSVHVFNKETW